MNYYEIILNISKTQLDESACSRTNNLKINKSVYKPMKSFKMMCLQNAGSIKVLNANILTF